MKHLQNKLALVTGAGSGIGRATALALAEEGARVIVTDLNEPSADATAEQIRSRDQWAESYQLDVTDVERMVDMAREVEQAHGPLDILVNNAGIAVAGLFIDVSIENFRKVMDINMMGVVNGCHAFLPAMVSRGQEAHVVNIASMAGYIGVGMMTAYCTTKFAVLGFSECLRAEMASHAIGVSAICPGLIRTNIIESGILESRDLDMEEKRKEIESLFRKRNYPPEKVGKAIIKVIRRNRAVAPVTPEARVFYYVKRCAPWFVSWLARRELV
jgi:NAD(P)-dependent dehydrogenase (short-subunit alcohol dehydrogenase family)